MLLTSLLGPSAKPDGGVTDQQQKLPTARFDRVEGEVDTEVAPGTIPVRERRECPELDSQLYQLFQADNRPVRAEQLGFRVKDD